MRIRFLVLFLVAAPASLLAQDPMARADSAWLRGEHSRVGIDVV